MESLAQINQQNLLEYYYIAQLSDEGDIETADKTKQFIVEKNAEVRFKLRRGCKVSNQAHLLINKPIIDEMTGQISYTVTQPKVPTNMDPELLDYKVIDFKESPMDSQYLERLEPYNAERSLNLEFRVRFNYPGSSFIQIEYYDEDIGDVNYTQPIIINVEPIIVLRDQDIKCKQLSIITVLARQLGQLSRWEKVLSNVSQLGYNAVHFTPVQKYGESYSHYSLADQTIIDDYYFGNDAENLGRQERLQLLRQTVEYARDEYGLLGIIDIVLNHTANNSPWLLEHPQSAYTTDNCPHLYPAFLLDRALADFSDDYSDKRNMGDCPSAPYLNNENDLKAIINAIQNRIINKFNFHEFFLFNIEKQLKEVRDFLTSSSGESLIKAEKAEIDRKKWLTHDHYTILEDKLTLNLGYGPERNSVKLDLSKAASYFYFANNQNVDKACQELRTLLQKHNQDWTIKVKGFMQEALNCIEGTIKYFKLELRSNKIEKTEEGRLVRRYFTELKNDQQSKVAHNGWIMNADPMEDFAMKGWHYLRRTINIWSDSVKLRYGSCPSDSPYLWFHMAQYVSDMASVFDGFRLDNAHSTPIHVSYFLLQCARSINPNLYVMAELFTSSSLADAVFVQKLNINGLVREIQNTYDPKGLGDYFHQLTCSDAPPGLIDKDFENVDGTKYRILKPVKPNVIIYDCTHDNPAPVEKFKTGRISLSHMGLISVSDCAIATTWGYDQLIPKNLHVVNEKRLYEFKDQTEIFKPDNEDPEKRRGHKLLEKKLNMKGLANHLSISPERTPEESKQKVPTDFDHEFVFYNDKAGSVAIAGCFTEWKPILQMRKEGANKWTYKLNLPIIQDQNHYEFKFVVNGNDWQLSKDLPQLKDKSGNVNNVIYMPRKSSSNNNQQVQQQSPHYKQNTQEYSFSDIKYARRILNEIHEECTSNNAEIFLHQQTDQVLVVVRQFLLDHEGIDNSKTLKYDAYVSITRHPYFNEGGEYKYQTSIELPGFLTEVVMACYLEISNQSYNQFYQDKNEIKGAQANFKLFKDLSKFCSVERSGEKDILVFHTMPPSFTCILKTQYPQQMRQAVQALNYLNMIETSQLGQQLFAHASLAAFNHLLFRCKEEEMDISDKKRGPYGLNQYGQFVYSGITSIIHILRILKISGDMGHELFNNIREGNWLMEYTVDRLQFMNEDLNSVIQFLQEQFNHVKTLNNTFKPKYMTKVIEKLYNAAVQEVLNRRMNDKFIQRNDDLFVQRLAISTQQMWGRVPSTFFAEFKDSMAAGLPHFTTGYVRCWGRDTFIALRGLLISTGLENEAKQTILYFAKTMRHGLIPNLHDRCNNTRYNARDATWFFIQGIKDYVQLAKNGGQQILNEVVELHFRDNDQQLHWEKLKRGEKPRRLTIAQLIHEILQCHASGIQFREWNAGTQIDQCMKSEGFNINIYLDEQTGFVFGGNQHNCGTWMDKMGSSEKTGNRGIPATPRDGAPIELVALLYTALRFMEDMHDSGFISTNSVRTKSGHEWTYKEWALKIEANFEKNFWIPITEQEDQRYLIEKRYVRRRGIYKDVLRSSQAHTDYQLRPNLCVAMAYAPDLFSGDKAQICLNNVEKILMEQDCMGVKTLDPQDPNYKGDYINSDDSQGWNYHQGPEWLWPMGFFLKAKMQFSTHAILGHKQALIHEVMKFLVPHQKHIMKDVWEGLPELTNSHGKECKDSCTTQAWSIATILDALRDLYYK